MKNDEQLGTFLKFNENQWKSMRIENIVLFRIQNSKYQSPKIINSQIPNLKFRKPNAPNPDTNIQNPKFENQLKTQISQNPKLQNSKILTFENQILNK